MVWFAIPKIRRSRARKFSFIKEGGMKLRKRSGVDMAVGAVINRPKLAYTSCVETTLDAYKLCTKWPAYVCRDSSQAAT